MYSLHGSFPPTPGFTFQQGTVSKSMASKGIKMYQTWRGCMLGFLAALVGVCLSTASQAVQVSGLYETVIDVEGRAGDAFTAAASAGLRQILVRVTGSSDIDYDESVQQALKNPKSYIQQYGYEKAVIKDPENGLPLPGFKLKMSFDKTGIDRLIRSAGLPIWTGNRPDLLLWAGVEDKKTGARAILTHNLGSEVLEQVQVEMNRRGIPFSLPLYDLQDQMAVSVSDVWGVFSERVNEASARYSPGATLLGKLYQVGPKQWKSTWLLMGVGSDAWVEFQGESSQAVVAQATDWTADRMGKQYALILDASESQDYLLAEVRDVNTLEDYARLNDYLQRLVPVREAKLVQLFQNSVRYQLYLDSDYAQLKQLLRIDNQLLESEEQLVISETKAALPNPSSGNMAATSALAGAPLSGQSSISNGQPDVGQDKPDQTLETSANPETAQSMETSRAGSSLPLLTKVYYWRSGRTNKH